MQKILIKQITIKESPLFKDETFYPSEHFNVFSGASGAGKSVLMEAILALFGLRESHAQTIEAILEVRGIAEEFQGFIEEGEITLTVSRRDKVRYFLNAQNIPKKRVQDFFAPFLKHLGVKSHESLSTKNLFLALDGFVSAQEKEYAVILEDYCKSFAHYQNTKNALNKLKEEALKITELREFVSFEIQKLESLQPKKGEYEELLLLKKEISKKEKISASLQEVQNFLNQAPQVLNFLNLIEKEKERDSILSALNELESLCDQQNELLESLQAIDPESILNRIEELSALNKRYGGIDAALEFLESKKQELQKYENFEESLKDAEKQASKAQENLKQTAQRLGEMRFKYLESFKKSLNQALQSLKMPQAKISLTSLEDVESYTPQGAQTLEITLNTTLKNLSSGEFNRFILALLLTQSTQIKHQAIIILDEVDANLSGEESQGVALALKQLSTHYQVCAISHQPHMPALADAHFLIQKGAQGSKIIPLDKEGRIQEIARTISGEVITKEAIEFATKQLENL